MSVAPKPVVAGVLLSGVLAVWMPRLTGFDPFGWLGEDLPRSSSVPSSGGDPHAVLSLDGEATTVRSEEELGDESLTGEALRSLTDVVEFLERRNQERLVVPPVTAVEVLPQIGVVGADEEPEAEALATSVTPVEEPTAESDITGSSELDEEESAEGPRVLSFAERLNAFLVENPLHTIIQGGGLATATFGYRRVELEQSLLEGEARVLAIEAHAVTLDTPDGRIRVDLPSLGERTLSRRTAPAAPRERNLGEGASEQ